MKNKWFQTASEKEWRVCTTLQNQYIATLLLSWLAIWYQVVIKQKSTFYILYLQVVPHKQRKRNLWCNRQAIIINCCFSWSLCAKSIQYCITIEILNNRFVYILHLWSLKYISDIHPVYIIIHQPNFFLWLP